MKKHIVRIVLAGFVLSTAALLAAAEPEVVWPQEWTAFGPYRIKRMYPYRQPVAADLLPGEMLKTIPAELAIGGQPFQGKRLRFEEGRLDLAVQMPFPEPGGWTNGRTVYLMAPVTAAADTTIQIGAGADWWMQWWLDGRPVYDTLGANGNGIARPVSSRDHVFDLKLTQGPHILAVAVISNLFEFTLAVASPQELRANPMSFRTLMEAGRRRYQPRHWSIPINYASARADFQKALKLAATDVERAEAHLAAADNCLLDVWGSRATTAAAIRQEYAAAEALGGARPEQKARAALGAGETWLLENNGAKAREESARARTLSKQPAWAFAAQFATARAHLQEKNPDAARKELTELAAQANLDAKLAFDARLHLAALDVAPRIRPDHPRLFFNADTWPAVKARIEADAGGLRQLEKEVKRLPAEPEVKDWGGSLMTAAMVYRVRGDAALLAKIRKLLRATLDHYLLLADFNAHVETRIGFLAALDWLWNELPAAERDGLARDLLRFAYGWHVQDMLRGGSSAAHDPYYYAPAMHWYVGLVTLNPDMDAVDYLRAMALLGRGYQNHVVDSFGKRIEVMKDRGRVTRVDYAFIDLPTPSWTFLHCWRSAVGPVPDEWAFASGIAPSCVLRNVLGFKPGFFRDFGHAKSWRANGGWVTGSLLYDNLGQFIYFFSKTQPEEAAIAACLRERMKIAGCVGTGHYPIMPYVLDLSAAPPSKLPDSLPLARCYTVNGLVLMSSGFDPDESTYALYCCGGGNMAEHFDTGHFTIFKKGYLALDSGTRALLEGGTPSGENYDRASVAHNTVLIRMPGEIMGPEVQSNSGGQRKKPDCAKVLAFESVNKVFAYAATDATEAYHPDKCAQMIRQFLYLPPDHFVVFDRVVAKNADYPKTWLLHTANEPAVTGKEFRADQDQGRVFCRTLLPADAVLEKIGGPGKEFWADGRNWPIPAASTYLQNIGMTGGVVPENIGRWRVEVKPGAARTDDLFLHLIGVSDQTLEKMVGSRMNDQGGQVELSLAVGTRSYTIRLNKAGPVGGHVRIEEAGRAVVDKDLTREVMP